MSPVKQPLLYKYFTFSIIFIVILMAIIAHPPVWRIFAFYPPYSNGVTFSGFSFIIFLFMALNYLITGFLGYGIIHRFSLTVTSQLITKWVAGFFLGFVAIAGLERVSTFFFSGIVSYFLVSAIAIIIGYYFIAYDSTKHTNFQLQKHKFFTNNFFIFIIAALIFLATALMLQISQGELSWVGHGPGQYTHFLTEWMQQGYVHFPIILQHYDELSYHYWASFFYIKYINPIIAWWFTLALIKLSIYSFLYLVFRKLNICFWFSLIFASFLMFGTSSPLFNKYYLLMDASNPLFFTVHSGRIIGIGIIAFFLMQFLSDAIVLPATLGSAILLGLGLSTSSVSNCIWSIVLVLMILIIKSRSLKSTLIQENKYAFWIAPLAILLMLSLYPWHLGSYTELMQLHIHKFYTYLKLSACIVYLTFCGYVFFKCYKNTILVSLSRRELYIYLAFILSIIIGIFLLGNIFSGLIYNNKHIIHFLTAHKLTIQFMPEELLLKNAWTWKSLIDDHREFGIAPYNGYCFSAFYFAAYYGILITVILITNLLYFIRKESFSILDNRFFLAFLVFVASLPPLLFFMDYIDYSNRAWIKSRFLEIPIYSILILGFYFLYKFLSNRMKVVLAILCVFYCIAPFILTQRPQQIWANTNLLIKILDHTPGYPVNMPS